MPVAVVQMVDGVLRKGTELLGYFGRVAKFFFCTKEHQAFIDIHKFGDVFAHFARVVRDEQNSYAVARV